jgi:hypothetical protein
MKFILTVIIIGLLGYGAYTMWFNHSQQAAPGAGAPSATQTAMPDTAPAETPVAVATPKPRRLALDGIYWLVSRVPITTDAGVIGLPPGTEVHRISYVPQGIKVQGPDGVQAVVTSSQLTNDMDIALSVFGNDEEGRARLSERMAEEEKTGLQTPQEKTGQDAKRGSAVQPAGSIPTTNATPP